MVYTDDSRNKNWHFPLDLWKKGRLRCLDYVREISVSWNSNGKSIYKHFWLNRMRDIPPRDMLNALETTMLI